MGKASALRSARKGRAAQAPSSVASRQKKPASSSAPKPGYRILDYPMHYFAAVQRQNQINLVQVLRPLGLTAHAWRVLSALYEKDGQTVGQIAEITVLDRSGLGRLLEQMETEGLVERMAAPDDGRAVLIRLAPGGKKRHAATLPVISAHYRRLLRGVTDRDFKTLIQLLRRMKANALMMSDTSIAELE
jgi:DNA-binding MarR family transcriptional regulator